MSAIYDNWERLVAAVLKKEQLWVLFHQQSRSPSIISDASDDSDSSSSSFNLRSFRKSQTTLSNQFRRSYSSSGGSASSYLYEFSEIRTATNNFIGKRHSSNSSSPQSWRCSLNGKDVIVFQRELRKSMTNSDVQQKFSVIIKCHFRSIVKLLGISISGEHIYLVYEFVQGSDLGLCLRSKLNPNFTVFLNWMSRMQIATDVAHGLEYIHSTSGLSIAMVHKHVKSSAIIVTEPSFHAQICHFGAAELCGETGEEERAAAAWERQFEGEQGYMSPELKATQRSDVYAFGVVVLELLTGEKPLRYRFDRGSGSHRLISVIETAREVVEGGGGGVEGRLMLGYGA